MRPRVFLSYGSADYTSITLLRTVLQQHVKQGRIDFWYDDKIHHSSDWRSEILEHLTNSDTFILLISDSFLLSDFILEKEVPKVVRKWREGQAHIYPFVLDSCDWQNIVVDGFSLNRLQFAPVLGRKVVPLSRLNDEEQRSAVYTLVQRILVQKPPRPPLELPECDNCWWRELDPADDDTKTRLLEPYVSSDIWDKSPVSFDLPVVLEEELSPLDCVPVIEHTRVLLHHLRQYGLHVDIFLRNPADYAQERTFWSEVILDCLGQPRLALICLLLCLFEFTSIVDLELRKSMQLLEKIRER